ncbi:MAG: hypothetical protein ABSA76_04105 [Bacteroidales bacterium]
MKQFNLIATPALAILLLCSCASVKFFSDSGLKNKTGLKIFSARPYILSDNSSGKDKLSVIWLPDIQNPQYLVLRPGIGSNSIKLAFKEGSITSFGITADNNLPETINSLASLLSKSTAAIETLGSAPEASGSSPSASFELYEITVENDTTVLRRINISGKNPF